MRKFLLILLISASSLHARNIEIYQNGEKLGEMTPEQFEVQVSAAEAYLKILKAETDNNLMVEVSEGWVIPEKPPFEAPIILIWRGENKEILKRVELKLRFTEIEVEDDGWFLEFYSHISRVGFPLVTVFFIIVIL